MPEEPENLRQRVRSYRKRCRADGYVRIDAYIDPETEQMYQYLMQKRGMGRKELLTALLREAMEKEEESHEHGG
jgi:hypothetical protein